MDAAFKLEASEEEIFNLIDKAYTRGLYMTRSEASNRIEEVRFFYHLFNRLPSKPGECSHVRLRSG